MSRTQAISLVTLARMLHLTPGTVSRALRGTGRVSTATRARVLAAARKYHYVPNEHARRLLGAPSHVIGVLARSAYTAAQTDYYMLEFTHAFVAAAAAQGYSVQLLPNDTPSAALHRALAAHAMDGVIIIADTSSAGTATATALRPYPCVVISPARLTNPHFACIAIDRAAGSAAAAEHLLMLGHRRLAVVCGAEGRQDAKRAAFLAVCRRAGVAVPPAHIVTAGTSIETAFHAACTLVRQGVTAIFAETDWLALGCLHAVHHLGLAVPHDCSLVGFDDLAFAADLAPPLTTVRVPRGAIAIAALSLFRARVAGEHDSQLIEIPTELVRRASTAPPKPATRRTTSCAAADHPSPSRPT